MWFLSLFKSSKTGFAVVIIISIAVYITVLQSKYYKLQAKFTEISVKFDAQKKIVSNLQNTEKNLKKDLKKQKQNYEKLSISYEQTRIEADSLTSMYQRLYKRYYGTDFATQKFKGEIAKKYNLQVKQNKRSKQ